MGADIAYNRVHDSLRLDWGTFSFKCSTAAELRDTVGYCADRARDLAGEACLREGAGRRFFAHSLTAPDAGLLIRWSNHTDSINAGCASIDFQGTFWGQTDRCDRRALLLDLTELPGFVKCTRLDAQRTICDPQADAEQIWDGVRQRRLWVPGYTAYSQLSPMDSKGEAVNGASTVWGKPTAAVRCTTYNKAMEQKVKDQVAIRHEVRCRAAAAEGYFDALMTELRREGEQTEDTQAERTVCRSIIQKHMTYLDTSRYADIADRKEWPKNWKREVLPADFMGEVLDGEFIEVKPTRRLQKRLAERKAHADKQYGATYGLWLLVEELTNHPDLTENVERMLSCFFSRLKDEHADELQAMTGLDRQYLADLITDRRRRACENLEHDPDRPL